MTTPSYIALSENTSELQSFPPINTPTDEAPVTDCGADNTADSVGKPLLLLSQEEFCEHRFAVSYAAFSNSGQYVASVDVDGVVKVWTWSPQISTASTVMSRAAFLSLEWASKSDRWLLLGNKASNIRLFDVKEMKSFYEASGDPNFPRVTGLCSNPVSPTFVCCSCADKGRSGSGTDMDNLSASGRCKLSLWDLKTMKSEKHLPLESRSVCISTMMFNHNGQVLVTGGDDGHIRLFDVLQQKCIAHWEAHQGGLRSIVFSSDFNTFYSLGSDNKLKEWSVHKNASLIREHSIHPNAVPSVQDFEGKEATAGKLLALDSDGAYLLMCADENAAIYKKRQSGVLSQLMDVKIYSPSTVTTLDWSPNMDTKVCLTGYKDGRLVVTTLLSQ